MANRLDLHSILVNLLGSSHVYFQPPESIKMVYPAIVYNLDDKTVHFADNKIYKKMDRYSITYIDSDPDNNKVDEILENLSYCTFDRFFVSDNLNHYIFTLYY